jgi:hypothetical protein
MAARVLTHAGGFTCSTAFPDRFLPIAFYEIETVFRTRFRIAFLAGIVCIAATLSKGEGSQPQLLPATASQMPVT